MRLYEKEITIPSVPDHKNLLAYFARAVRKHIKHKEVATRFVVTNSMDGEYRCDLGLLDRDGGHVSFDQDAIFRFSRRRIDSTDRFNVALVVPTGVGCEIGGHAGDAGVVASLLAGMCDTLITHPNVVNASDINELPANGLYVEGSVLSRLMMGTVGLQPIRANRVLTIIDEHREEYFINQAVNAVSAARSCYGLRCPRIIRLCPPIKMRAEYTQSQRAAGKVEGLDRLQDLLDSCRGDYDAVAIASVVDVPSSYHMDYFKSGGEMINPWGGVEAMLTHWISLAYDVPSAHAPMLESQEVADLNPGVVDSRIAAEAISTTFMQCILKGLQRSPRIVTDTELMKRNDVLTAADVACLVIPNGCVGLPTLAALEQGITVIAVRENRNVMRNDLAALPWAPGQFYVAENYWEACGILAALKTGLAPESTRRPFSKTLVEQRILAASAPQADTNGRFFGSERKDALETHPAMEKASVSS